MRDAALALARVSRIATLHRWLFLGYRGGYLRAEMCSPEASWKENRARFARAYKPSAAEAGALVWLSMPACKRRFVSCSVKNLTRARLVQTERERERAHSSWKPTSTSEPINALGRVLRELMHTGFLSLSSPHLFFLFYFSFILFIFVLFLFNFFFLMYFFFSSRSPSPVWRPLSTRVNRKIASHRNYSQVAPTGRAPDHNKP